MPIIVSHNCECRHSCLFTMCHSRSDWLLSSEKQYQPDVDRGLFRLFQQAVAQLASFTLYTEVHVLTAPHTCSIKYTHTDSRRVHPVPPQRRRRARLTDSIFPPPAERGSEPSARAADGTSRPFSSFRSSGDLRGGGGAGRTPGGMSSQGIIPVPNGGCALQWTRRAWALELDYRLAHGPDGGCAHFRQPGESRRTERIRGGGRHAELTLIILVVRLITNCSLHLQPARTTPIPSVQLSSSVQCRSCKEPTVRYNTTPGHTHVVPQ